MYNINILRHQHIFNIKLFNIYLIHIHILVYVFTYTHMYVKQTIEMESTLWQYA